MSETLKKFLTAVCKSDTLKGYYAKEGCQQCHGRGEFQIQPPGHTTAQMVLCYCVKKAAGKEWSKINE